MSSFRLAVKDNIDVAGLPTTAGLKAWRNRIAQHDAPIVSSMRKRGATIVSKTLMDEAAFGALGDNPFYGRVDNPVRHGYTAGGSSAGSAAAVASNVADLALGTDTLGSVRIPASYCGVVGYVPSAGAVDMAGVVPLAPSFDRVGYFTRTVREMQTLVNSGSEHDLPMVKALTDSPFIEQAAERLRGAGCRIEHIDPQFDWKALRLAMLLQIEIEAAPAFLPLPDLSWSLRTALEFGRDAPPERRARAEAVMDSAKKQISAWMRGGSLLLLPSTPGPAFPFGGRVPADQADYATISSLLGLPAVSVPAPVASGELPIGIQLVAPLGKDASLLATAALIG